MSDAPTHDYRVQLDAYAGPLDLLLYLVKRHEIDLNDIPVAELTEQYLKHLEVIKAIDMERAGEFLVMAATLVEIKSQLLVPRPEDESGEDATEQIEGPESDPRFELVQQLLAYKRFKDAAIELEHREDEWAQRFPAHSVKASRPAAEEAEADEDGAAPLELDLEDVNLMDLCEAFARILDSIGDRKTEHQVTYDDTPISLHAADIYDRLVRDAGVGGRMTLRKVFEGRSRSEMIGLFLATLELVRQRKVYVVQEDGAAADQISLEARPEDEHEDQEQDAAEDTAADWRNPETGEIEYDWPDEEARRRADRRADMRAARAAQGELADVPMIEAFDDDDEDDLLEDDDDDLSDDDDA